MCDLTSKPRRVDIHYHCNPSSNDRIAMIKETASCVYLMVIHTPRLCNDVVFQPPQLEKPNQIVCREIISTEDEEQDWKDRTRRETEKVLKDEIVATEAMEKIKQELGLADVQEMLQQQQQPLVIGGITVGARHITGNTHIPPSAIILAAQKQQQQQTQQHLSQPNPNANANTKAASSKDSSSATDEEETYITTLAKSDGRYTSTLSDSEMKKLGLKGTREELENWIRQMDDLAEVGVPWRLDVVRLADGGMEFRGIVMDKEKETEKAEGGAGGGAKVVEGAGAEEVHEADEVGSLEEYK